MLTAEPHLHHGVRSALQGEALRIVKLLHGNCIRRFPSLQNAQRFPPEKAVALHRMKQPARRVAGHCGHFPIAAVAAVIKNLGIRLRFVKIEAGAIFPMAPGGILFDPAREDSHRSRSGMRS